MLATAIVTAGSRSGGGRALAAARGRMLAPSLLSAAKSAGTASSRSALPASAVVVGTNHNHYNCTYSTSAPTSYSLDRPTGGSPFSSSPASSSSGGDGTGAYEMAGWPIRKSNTILNVVPQGQRFIVERFGKLSAIHDSGYFFAVPFVDHIGELVRVCAFCAV